jgi:TRAP-type C4-dicarboxylate transport system permease large subunit
MVLGILLGAQMIGYAFVQIGANRAFTDWVAEQHLSKYWLLAAICALFVALGDFVEGVGMMLITVPILFPIVLEAGFDPIWFGIVMAVLIELGQITPPVGLNIFIIRSFDRSVAHSSLLRSATPNVFAMLALIVALACVPDIALWLPQHTGR